jgi:hypothetical protein
MKVLLGKELGLALLVAASLTLSRTYAHGRPDAGLSSQNVEGPLSRNDVCELVDRITHSRLQDIAGSSIVDQTCTKNTVGMLGRLAIDVGVMSADGSLKKRPLARGEGCGAQEFIVGCDEGNLSEKCSVDPKFDQHWKLAIRISVESSRTVKVSAAVLPYDQPAHSEACPGCRRATVSPCGPTREARFEKVDGRWKEVWNRFKKPSSAAPSPDGRK